MATPFVVDQSTLTAGLRDAADFRRALDERRTEMELRRTKTPEIMRTPGINPATAPRTPTFQVPEAKAAPAPQQYPDITGEYAGLKTPDVVTPDDPRLKGPTPQRLTNPNVQRAVMMAESGGDPLAVSPKGAMGRFQVMPGTAADPGFGIAPAKDNSAAELDRVGKEYLNAMLQRYDGDINRALVAYNWGPGNADNWDGNMDSLPGETQQYIMRIRSQIGPDVLAFEPQEVGFAPGVETPAPASTSQTMPPKKAGVQTEQVDIGGKGRSRMRDVEVPKQAGVAEKPKNVGKQIAVGKVPTSAPVVAPPYINDELRVLSHYRNVFATKMDAMRRAGDIRYYDEVQKLAQTDAAIMNLVNQRAVDVFNRMGNPDLVNQYMQHYNPGWVLRPRSDGAFHIEYQGQVASEPLSKDDVVRMLRYTGDTQYAREQDAAITAAQTSRIEAERKLQSDLLIKALEGQIELSKEQMRKMGITKGVDGEYYTNEYGQTYRLLLETKEDPLTGNNIGVVTKLLVGDAGGISSLSNFKVN